MRRVLLRVAATLVTTAAGRVGFIFSLEPYFAPPPTGEFWSMYLLLEERSSRSKKKPLFLSVLWLLAVTKATSALVNVT